MEPKRPFITVSKFGYRGIIRFKMQICVGKTGEIKAVMDKTALWERSEVSSAGITL